MHLYLEATRMESSEANMIMLENFLQMDSTMKGNLFSIIHVRLSAQQLQAVV